MSARQKVFGLGTDLCRISRVLGAWERHGERFLKRAYAEQEIERFHDLRERLGEGPASEFLASRWAAKEAAQKALSHWRVLFPEIRVGRGSAWGEQGGGGGGGGGGGSLSTADGRLLHDGFARLPRDRPGDEDLEFGLGDEVAAATTSADIAAAAAAASSSSSSSSLSAHPAPKDRDRVPAADASRVRPQLVLSGKALSLAESLNLDLEASPLSISHDGEYAVATVLLLQRGRVDDHAGGTRQ